MAKMLDRLHWLGHSSFRWDGSKTIYFDPWKLSKDAKKSDIICVSHEHFDHMSKPDIALINTKETVIVTCQACAKEIKASEVGAREVIAITPGDLLDLPGVKIRAVASYNTDKEFHRKPEKKLGFVVTMDGLSVYHAGDTDRIPEMDGLKPGVALLPVSGTYVMTAEEAVDAALAIGPKIAVPMHYGDIVGSASDAKRFEAALRGKIEVQILLKEDV